jgi:hypothetical protein
MNGVFPTAYFGSIAYFQAIAQKNNVCIEAKEHFVKQSVRTRCDIMVSNGLRYLSVPVIKKNGNKTAMDDIEISYTENWQTDHWRTIESAYSSAPFFEHYGEEIKALIFSNETNLLRFNEKISKTILAWLSIDSVTMESTLEFAQAEHDFRSYPFDDRLKTHKYTQVFEAENGFISNLSILDLIMNEGPMARKWLLAEG